MTADGATALRASAAIVASAVARPAHDIELFRAIIFLSLDRHPARKGPLQINHGQAGSVPDRAPAAWQP
jgi:hypothetical protein